MQSCLQRAIKVCVILTAGGCFLGCAEGSSSLANADGGGSSFAGEGGASAGRGGGGGSSIAQGGDAASSGGGALGSSGASDGGGGVVGQGGSDGAAVGGDAPGAGGAAGASGSAESAGKGGAGGVEGSAGSGGHAGSNGGGGAGGGGGTVRCSDHPLSAKSSWVVTSSSADAASPLVNVDDGNLATRWSTGVSQKSDWLQVDFRADVALDSITLMLGSSPGDYPRAYQVRLSETTHDDAATTLATGAGQQAMNTVVNLTKPAVGRYLLISQVGSVDGTWWSVAELMLACTH